jgi:hypothetical protein
MTGEEIWVKVKMMHLLVQKEMVVSVVEINTAGIALRLVHLDIQSL